MNQHLEPEQFHQALMQTSHQNLSSADETGLGGNSRNRKATLAMQISGLGDLDRNELAARWTKIYGCPPPSGVRRELLAYAVAWSLQTRRLGGLSTEARRALKLAMANTAARLSGGDLPNDDQSDGETAGPLGIDTEARLPGLQAHKNDAGHVNADRTTADGIGAGFNSKDIGPDRLDHSNDRQKFPARQPSRILPQPGTRLIREWNGKTNVVDVVKGGYLFEGKSYRSLSAIARTITNAHWSGPRFFGL